MKKRKIDKRLLSEDELPPKRVSFLTFVRGLDADDNEILSFKRFAKNNPFAKKFRSHDPRLHLQFIRHFDIDERMHGYVKCMELYFDFQNNLLPDSLGRNEEKFFDIVRQNESYYFEKVKENLLNLSKEKNYTVVPELITTLKRLMKKYPDNDLLIELYNRVKS